MISQQTQSDTITLSVTNSVGSTHEFPLLPNAGVFVGRSSNCRVQLAGDGLSDIHCRIELENGKVWVQDWMSAAGTQVNGETITTKVEITGCRRHSNWSTPHSLGFRTIGTTRSRVRPVWKCWGTRTRRRAFCRATGARQARFR